MGSLSVIVPVYNEAQVLGTNLPQLIEGLSDGARIVIVCNGCTDESAVVAREIAAGHKQAKIEIIETGVNGKSNAIRLGEAAAGNVFPRFFVDSDVIVSGHTIEAMATELERGDVDVVSPVIDVSDRGCSFAAAQIVRIWRELPYMKSGAYRLVIGVSREGRKRWGALPDIIADDTFMALQVDAARRKVETLLHVTEIAPQTFWSFTGVRARWLMGDRQLQKLGYRMFNLPKRNEFFRLWRSPRTCFAATIYALHHILASSLATWWILTRPTHWYRDTTQRQAAQALKPMSSEREAG